MYDATLQSDTHSREPQTFGEVEAREWNHHMQPSSLRGVDGSEYKWPLIGEMLIDIRGRSIYRLSIIWHDKSDAQQWSACLPFLA